MYKVKWWLKRQWKLIHRLNIDYRTLKLKILHDYDDSQSVLPFILLLSVANLRKTDMVHVCLFCRLTNLFCSSVLCCLARLFCSISLFIELNRPTICPFRCFKKHIMYNDWFYKTIWQLMISKLLCLKYLLSYAERETALCPVIKAAV